MKIEPNRIKTQIDFGATRGHPHSDLLFTTLMHYNRGSSTNMTASQLIVTSYKKYSPAEPEDITSIFDFKTKATTLLERYNIQSRAELWTSITKRNVLLKTELLEPNKKFFCFDADDPTAVDLWEILKLIRYRDRGVILNRFLYQYFAHGNCEFYNHLCADRLLQWMKDEASFIARFDSSHLECIIDCIWNIAGRQENTNSIKISDDKGLTSDEKLRKAIGLI